ncbi:MAG: hypothetical protein A2V86_11505 [Deltaproteobacteria bacterium RBG_16_49_23]|nr:MAG: hypothetical protein A2V86_11505 [Deltaproteobacteria bacterium RBG_16_49_23]
MTEGPHKLPNDWRWVKLGEVAGIIMGQSPPGGTYNTIKQGPPFYQGKADFGELHPHPRFWCSEPQKIADHGDILISVRAPVGPTNLAEEQCCIGRGLAALRPQKDLEKTWLLYYLRNIEAELQRSGKGSAFAAIKKKDLEELFLPFPPPHEQHRILTKVDALMERVREAKRLRIKAREDAERLMQGILSETFPNPQNDLSHGWICGQVADISENPQYGYTQSAKDDPVGPKFLRITDIQNGDVNWQSVPYCICDDATISKYLLQDGDIMFARSGATTGKTYLVKECPKAVFASYLIRLRLRPGVMPEYLFWFFQSPFYWNQIKLRGAAQPNMNARILGSLRIPLPSSEREQRRIVEYLNTVKVKVLALNRGHEHTKAELQRLEQAVLDRAFRGEL